MEKRRSLSLNKDRLLHLNDGDLSKVGGAASDNASGCQSCNLSDCYTACCSFGCSGSPSAAVGGTCECNHTTSEVFCTR